MDIKFVGYQSDFLGVSMVQQNMYHNLIDQTVSKYLTVTKDHRDQADIFNNEALNGVVRRRRI